LWYISAAAADAQADIRETGFRTAFHGEDYLFYILETGVTPRLPSGNGPLQGAYRAGLWYDPQEKERLDDGKIRRDDTGFYLTFDQMLHKENKIAGDTQGLGLFGRHGWASSKVNEITNFWSVGIQYQGPIAERDEDVLALGFAQGIFSNRASGFSEDDESVFELYYSAQITPWLAVSPSIQYVADPGGSQTASDAVVLGVRVQMSL
jgi:porin